MEALLERLHFPRIPARLGTEPVNTRFWKCGLELELLLLSLSSWCGSLRDAQGQGKDSEAEVRLQCQPKASEPECSSEGSSTDRVVRGQFGGRGLGWDRRRGDKSLHLSFFAVSSHIRHAWDHTKSVRQNLAEMGLAMDPNKAVPLRKRKVLIKQGSGTFLISTLALPYFSSSPSFIELSFRI